MGAEFSGGFRHPFVKLTTFDKIFPKASHAQHIFSLLQLNVKLRLSIVTMVVG